MITFRRAGTAAVAAAALMLASPVLAYAATASWEGTLVPGQEECVGAKATFRAVVAGSATEPGVRFRVYRDGVLLADTGKGGLSLNLSYTRAGFYTLCAKYPPAGQDWVNAQISVRTDRDAA